MELRTFNDFRASWCRKPPLFRVIMADEPYYNLGMACPDSSFITVHIPIEDLPPVLAALR
jgi:hypothetical protein